MKISVIIPARNSGKTLARALDSLIEQTFRDWEAVIIDDGSTDETLAVATRYAERDVRFRVFHQAARGVSAARNTGIGLSRFDWLLFLDSDDSILPTHLEQMTGALLAAPELDAVHCGWINVAPNGQVLSERRYEGSGDLFAPFVRSCIFAIHACIVRKSLVLQVGGFDTSLTVGEDWDLWQRIARTGARFGALPAFLSRYHIHAGSTSLDGRKLFVETLRVLERGFSPDPRVPGPDPAHVNGEPTADLPLARFYLLCYAAGLMIGRWESPLPLLDLVYELYGMPGDPAIMAEVLFEGILHAAFQEPTTALELNSDREPRVKEFLYALEKQVQTPELAPRVLSSLEALVVNRSNTARPFVFGKTLAIQIDITEPIPDCVAPSGSERLDCVVLAAGERIGSVILPIFDAGVPSQTLTDAIAARFAWEILEQFFKRTIYPELFVGQEPTPLAHERQVVPLMQGLTEQEIKDRSRLYQSVGWTVFMQEIWARPYWKHSDFYDSQVQDEPGPTRRVWEETIALEVSEELPELESTLPELDIVVTVGGAALGSISVPVYKGRVRSQELRARIAEVAGFELCCLAVREGLLGKPFVDGSSLRDRLAAAADKVCRAASWLGAPGSGKAVNLELLKERATLVLGRRADPIGTSASRRAMLPAVAAAELVRGAALSGEPIIHAPEPGERVKHVVYAPDLILPAPALPAVGNQAATSRLAPRASFSPKRYEFETFFARQTDPWGYTSAYEQAKYEQTLALLPSQPVSRALEIGCAEGHFTVQLGPRVESLLASDISQVALERAACRCHDLTNVEFARLDVLTDPIQGTYELIVASEMMYYLDTRERVLEVASKLVHALEPGGYLLMAHAHLVIDEPDKPGFDWGSSFGAKAISEIVSSISALCLVKQLRTPLYRIELYRKAEQVDAAYPSPEIVEVADNVMPPPEVARHVRWNGGIPTPVAPLEPVVTDRLPILMYHRVAPAGSQALAPYRVTPQAFEQQLEFLADAGFYSIRLEDWQAAAQQKRPLPGRAILLTFDDGYADLITYALPVLKRYGFSALVFLVAEQVGRSNVWDQTLGEQVRLLDWNEIRELQQEGIEFGSHTVTHRSLLACSPTDVVCEAVRSRSILEHHLRASVKTIAYPYGESDAVVRHLAGACGYIYGLTTDSRLARFDDPLLALPRVFVSGSDDLAGFVRKIGEF